MISPPGMAYQTAPRVDSVGGQSLIVWQANGLDGSLYGIYGAFLSAGRVLTGPFKINHYTEHDQREPALAGGANGRALVVWSSYGQDGDRGGIFGRFVRFQGGSSSPLRAPMLGEEVEVAEVRAGHQRHPQVVADAAGYWVAWETVDDNGLSSVLSLRRLGLNGIPEAAEVRIKAPEGEQRRLVGLESPTPESVVLQWWEADAQGRNFYALHQVVGAHGFLGPEITDGD